MEASALPVCAGCRESFVPLRKPLCETCGRPFGHPVAIDDGENRRYLCRLCLKGVYRFQLARSFASYNEVSRRAIVMLKYEEITRLGDWFAGQLAGIVAEDSEKFAADLVAPVPLHPSRLRERGYNQAELIARPLARLLRIPYKPHLLVRTKPRPPKLMLSRSERWRSVRGAYAVAEGAKLKGQRILIVDDLFTTGATMDACAGALRKAGAARVVALTVARVVMPQS